MVEEIELKLALKAGDGDRLCSLPLVESFASVPASESRLVSTYYDTPGRVLQAAGMALRVRRKPDGWVQTLKAPLLTKDDGEAGLQHLREFEAAVPGEAVDLSLIEDEELQAFFAENRLGSDLEAMFRTEFTRRARRLNFMDSVIEMAVDDGEIVSGEQRQALHEAELELVQGRPSRLFELGLLLNDAVPARLERRSKAVRGYDLYAPQAPGWSKGAAIGLARKATVGEAFETKLRGVMAHLRDNERAVLETEEPEGVHQMRVALRRLRALVSAFRPAIRPDIERYLASELRWLQRQLGPARDWDVFLEETVAVLRERLPGEESLEALEAAAQEERAKVYEMARGAVLHPRYTTLLLRLNLWLLERSWRRDDGLTTDATAEEALSHPDAPAVDFANDILRKRARKVMKMGKRLDSLSEAELHRLRINIKKLRYAAEFFEPLYARKSVKRYLKALVGLQDDLGAINDSVTGQSLLDVLDARLAAAGGASEAVAANATGIVLGWQTHLLKSHLDHLPDGWKRFAAEDRFWT